MKKNILISAVLIAVCAAIALVPTSTIEVPSTAHHSFTIDTPMARVRKILVRTNAVKKIVAMANAKYLDQNWLNLNFEIERPILDRQWDLHGSGELMVQIDDSYLGRHDMTLQQTVEIQPEELKSNNRLKEAAGPIEFYTSDLKLVPDENGNAKFICDLELKIKTKVNWIWKARVENGIRNSASSSLEKQEQAIRTVVQQHADELLILPGK